MMDNLINPRTYVNGNTQVTIDLATGTKIRFTEDDEFKPEFAESCDVHISDRCDNGCEFCYAGCSMSGDFGKLSGWKFFDSLHPYTEMAINLQIPLTLGIYDFLELMKEKKVIVNATVNQNHFMKAGFREVLKRYQDDGLIHGLGISVTEPTKKFIELANGFDNVVLHVINGIVTTDQLHRLSHNGFKILILGYKNIGRGAGYIENSKQSKTVTNRKNNLYWNLKFIIDEGWFTHIAFDNLALEQLNPRRFLSDEEWELIFQGNDGTSTFFINLVDGTFGKNSLTTREERFPIGDKSVDEMFRIVVEGN